MINPNNNGGNFSELINDPHEARVWSSAPSADWTDMTDSDHFVQFYEADSSLLSSLSGYIGTGLSSGGAAIIIATRAHRLGLMSKLQAAGIDVLTASASGKYVSLDAAQTLSKFMVDGLPEPARFRDVVGNVLTRVTDGRNSVRAFGEMVALLWAEGNYNAAIRLEELWNDLQRTHSFSLFCAYPMSSFSGQSFVAPLNHVCEAHSRVIPAESYAELANRDERLRAIIQLQQKAKTLEAEIRERELAQEQLRASLAREQLARAEAETANRLKDEFLATVSHELRTPLNAIMGWSHILRHRGVDPATMERAFETIDRNAKAQAQLIEDILDVSRVITGKLHLNMEPVDLATVINSSVDSVQFAANSKEIQLGVMLDPSARHTLGDAGRLQQVVWNLLSNAIKFTPVGGRVEVKVERVDADVQISVSDNGSGINPEFLPYIFDRFRQADGSLTRNHGGLGLGLAIVRHLVEMHGGSVRAESDGESYGSTFILRLPLRTAQERAQTARGEIGSLWPGSEHLHVLPLLENVQVLLVDDNLDSLQILTDILTERKAKVQTAASVAEALEVLEWFKPDVVVSDLAMPDEDGFSLIGKLRRAERSSQIPAIALTALVRVEDRTRALAAGFNMFVPKPVEPTELITAVASLTDRAP